MPPRFTALSALYVTAGCAANASGPAARPTGARAAPSAAVTQTPESDATAEAPGAATQRPPPPGAERPGRSIAPSVPATPAIPAAPGAPQADPFGDVGFKEVDKKHWLAELRNHIAQREKIAPPDLCLSPGLLRAAFVRTSPGAAPGGPGRRPPLRHHEIVVVDNQGGRVASFHPLAAQGSDEPPGDLRFLTEERLVYEVVGRAPAAAPPASRRPPAPAAKGRPSGRAAHVTLARETRRAAPATSPPFAPRLFVIQPIAPRARAIRCQGLDFTFTREHDRLAFVGGPGGAAFVAVDGAQVYPRRGRTVVASAPVWSRNGHSLAFLELPAARPARLVLVGQLDDPRGDLTWDLPADSKIDGASVSWASTGKLVVRRAATRPIFSASFIGDE
jgi:hypothetical protein